MKQILRNILDKRDSNYYSNHYKKIFKKHKFLNNKYCGEEEWMKKWSCLGKPKQIYYRLFYNYIGADTNIVPEDICRHIIEPILNPVEYRVFYSDKNMFDKLFSEGTMPLTIFRNIYGAYYDLKYNRININSDEDLFLLLFKSGCKKICIKPTVDSCSGNGVRLFFENNGRWCMLGNEAITLSLNLLNEFYGVNYIVQEGLDQFEDMSYYNLTSINTLRISLYRSVKTNKCNITNAVLRIGARGTFVDNAHSGGGFVGIDINTGKLLNKVFNQYGDFVVDFNGIDFSLEHSIYNWQKIVDFAKSIGDNILHMRLLSLDIAIDKNGQPKLIEFNCQGYGMWIFQYTSCGAFGQYTDEILEYCKNQKNVVYRLLGL